ncbi:MAG: hypothetical protein U0174_00245 [Polyangiaceae bacterium]
MTSSTNARRSEFPLYKRIVSLFVAMMSVFCIFLQSQEARADDEDRGVRLRLGFNVGGGVVVGDATGGVVGGGIRGGLQLNNFVGLYLQTGGNVLLAAPPTGAGDITAIAFIPVSPMVSLSPVPQLEFALGPSLDYYGGATASSTNGGAAFGIAGRASVHPFGRTGFALSADIHPLFIGGVTIVPITFGLGFDFR